jgi:hypothetical protein
MIGWSSAYNIIKGGLEIASAASEIYGAYTQAKSAEKLQDLQEAEYRRMQQIEAARAKKDARIRTAHLRAQQGQAGAVTSMGSAGVVGISSSLEYGLEDLSQRTGFNIGSTKMQESASKTQAYAQGFLGVASFAAGAKNFSDILGTQEVSLSQTQEDYPYIARRG